MKRTMILFLCFMIIICAAGCNGSGANAETPPGTSPSTPTPTTPPTLPTPPQPTEPAVPQIEMHAYADRIYTSPNYERRYYYTLRLSENHTFQMTGSIYLSTFMMGTWAEADGELVLISGSDRYYFQITESGFTFLRSRSDSNHVIQDLAEGALFVLQLPESESVIATYYETNPDGTGEPIRLVLGSIPGNEGKNGYYSFGNKTVNGMDGKGEWEIQDDLLVMFEPKEGYYPDSQYLYFQITEDGFVFLPERSDRWPLVNAWPEDAVLYQKTEESKEIVAELYTYQPAGSHYKYELHLFDDFYYYYMSPSGGLLEGICYADGDMLVLTDESYYNSIRLYFRITEEGYLSMADQALFTADQPAGSPTVGAYYMLPTDGADLPARLFLSDRNVVEFYGPDHRSYFYGKWSQEDGILRIEAYGETDDTNLFTFRIQQDSICFLAEQSDSIAAEYGLEDGMRFHLVLPGEAAPPVTKPSDEVEMPPPPPTTAPTEPTTRPTRTPVEGDTQWGFFDGKSFICEIAEVKFTIELITDGTFTLRNTQNSDYKDHGIWNLEGNRLTLIGWDENSNENGYVSIFQYIPEEHCLVFYKSTRDLPSMNSCADNSVFELGYFIAFPNY